MRKHGWQLPYHPLQVVAVAVFMALGFAYYVFFAPFVGKKLFQYIAMGIYTPLIISVFSLYIWCAAADPADPGVFKSKKYLKTKHNHKHTSIKESKLGMDSSSSIQDANSLTNPTPESNKMALTSTQTKRFTCLLALLLPCTSICHSSSSNESLMSEDGMFCCSLCEVEVYKYSKHCRVCDKCVDHFDHHCRWINNCIGKKNYRKFFTLMVSALFLLIIQWSTGILVLILCFLERKKFSQDIASNLGSSFTVAPFVIVVAICTILAMIASFPLAQLFFFHILLVKKGISTYDYIIALREQEQGNGVQQSPQLSQASSLTGLSSASSFNTFHRAAWCTPPRLFVEDQFDVVPTETGSVSSLGKKPAMEEPVVKKAVKISPWTLAKLNTEEVTKAASEARKKSKILQPIAAKRQTPYTMETGSTSRRVINRLENNRKRSTKRIRLPTELPFEPSDNNISLNNTSSLAFRTHGIIASSSESSLESPDLPPFQISAPIPLSRSTSDGYDASGGEDSDRVSSRFVQRSANWSSLLFGSEHNRVVRN